MSTDIQTEKEKHFNSDVNELAIASEEPSAKVKWFRSTLVQVLIVGMTSFLAPGAYSSLASVGAGGLANVNIGNASVALAYALIVPSALCATACLSTIGPRYSLSLGAAGYVFYAAALYQNSATGNQPFLIVGAIICGATSGIFWVSEAAVTLLYSEPQYKGRHLAIWQSLFQLATCIGGAINLGLNIDLNETGGLKPKTFLVFVGLNAVAPLAALLLSNPKQVQRRDRLPVPAFPAEPFFKEVWLTILELRDPRIIACCFLWSQSLFIPSWTSTYLAVHFSVRVRGLTSLITPLLTIITLGLIGSILDIKSLTVRYKLVITWGFLQILGLGSAIWLLVMQVKQSKELVVPTWDWSTPGFGAAWVPYLFSFAAFWTSYGFFYYMATYCFPREASGARTTRIIATLRSAESGAAAIAFGINSINVPLHHIGYINVVFIIVCLFCGSYVLQWIWTQDKKGAYNEVVVLVEPVPAAIH
ncbi:hypothetical protein I302_104661 [Kwoniella bestiolae CBS 10118]|uniref:MFS general substrate transporter n=1 Tax=Kwoniella bestiolae CBS 10118 TaxID=1296100 RepID=A0A1B9GBX1_9TREE|nr:hypothetical protein I302_03371 [Kwoniella bestiolae CBS 10118]OCF28512.1 hypothetical protein I302_03371 [Kwoniella bestiolae CBS 10118]